MEIINNLDYVSIGTLIIGVMIVIVIAKSILHLNLFKILGLIINSILGYFAIIFLNYTGIFSIPLNIFTTLLIGVFGIPGVILLIMIDLLGII